MSNQLQKIEGAARALAEAETLDEIKYVHDIATAAAEYARAAKLGLEAQNSAATIKLRAERKAGELLAGLERERGGSGRFGSSIDVQTASPYAATLAETDTSRQQANRWQAVAQMPEEKFEAYIEETIEAGDELTTAGVLRVAKAPDVTRVNSRGDYDWYTPEKYIVAARDVLGEIDLDPASSDKANTRVMARTIYTVADDGLLQDWHGRVWLNPPYGGAQADFTQKLVDEYEAGRVDEAILLVNSNATDTRWFAPLWDHVLCFTDHRINFDGLLNQGASSSTHGSVFVYFGPYKQRFAERFAEFGAAVCRYE
jgi:phage N-6-adenine-methyltransferase